MRLWSATHEVLLAQRGHLFGWLPVCLACGIGVYFGLRFEPVALHYLNVAGACACCLVLWRLAPVSVAPMFLGMAVVTVGIMLAGLRAHQVEAPILTFRYYGPIEGRIVHIDRSASDAVRLTLDQVRLDRMAPDRVPDRVRVSLYGDQLWMVPEPGLRVMLTGHLSPPNGPAEPGGFDFRRMAWFQQLGAVGYTRTPVLIAQASEGTADLWLHRLRVRVSHSVQERIPGDAGGFAAAIMTGDRAGLSLDASENMRVANLYHLVSISGMHMGMLAAFIFGVVRTGVALIPPLALRVSGRKVAAAVALPAAAFYLALAGRAIPTERAFVMVAVMLVAILCNRRALSLRSVAIAALIVLALRPESLINPGFQMSFAAVVALVFAFGRMPTRFAGDRAWYWRLLIPVATLLFSSLVAGSATAPYAAAHFNRVAHYGVIANLFAVPLMGLIVMPGAVMLAVLGPLGIEQPALWMIRYGSEGILWVAAQVSALEGAVSAVPKPPWEVLPLLTLGALLVVLWQGRGKAAGAVPVCVALALWWQAERPELLISASGGLMGQMTEDGRVLSKPRGDGFVASIWLENDGSTLDQEAAADGALFERAERIVWAQVGPLRIVQVSGVRALEALEGCGGADILVSNQEIDADYPCAVFDIAQLRQTGALALYQDAQGVHLMTTSQITGQRLWHLPQRGPELPRVAGLLQ